MVPILRRLREAIRLLRWGRFGAVTAFLGATCLAAIPILKQLSLPFESVAIWIAAGLGVLLLALTSWRLRRYSLAPPSIPAAPGVMAIKGAGSFTPEDAELFSRLGRMEELKTLRSWVLDTDKVPVVALMGESGVGKTSLLRAGLTFILSQGKEPVPHVYWEANPDEARASLLRKIEVELGTRDLGSLPTSVIVVDQLEQLDPEHNADLFQLLRAHLESEPPFKVTWIIAFRREWGSTWFDFQLAIPERFRHRPQMMSLRRFSQRQAKEVFATLAEEAKIEVREALVKEILEKIVEDGTVSPVDLGITLQVLHRQPDLAEDPAAFSSVGGHAGLLTLYLEMILEQHQPDVREEVMRALLGLINEEEDRRLAQGRLLAELRDLVRPSAPRYLELALEALAQPGVRVLEIVEETPRRYRLIHERFIPALRRLAGELLGAADRASRLLERRYLLWQREDHKARFLLHGRELREILKQQGALRWGKSREQKWRFLRLSCRRRRHRLTLAAAAVALVALSTAWLVQDQKARSAMKEEMFVWGFPAGTYEKMPMLTDLASPPVTNTRWVSRAKKLRSLSLTFAPQYKVDQGQTWPASLEHLSLDLSTTEVKSFTELPSSLQQLTLYLRGSRVTSLPELPPSLQQLTLDIVSFSEVSSLPDLPSSLQQLTLHLRGSGVSSLPDLPSSLQQLTLHLRGSGVPRLPDLPSSLQQLTLGLRGSGVSSLPDLPSSLQKLTLNVSSYRMSELELPSSLQQLTLNLRGLGVTSWPELPSSLQQLTINLGERSWPDLPSSLQQLTLDLSNSGVTSWPELPSSLQQLTLYLRGSRVTSWPELPPSLQQLTLDSGVTSWPDLPSSLQKLTLDLRGWGVTSWPDLPSSLQKLTLDLRGSGVTSWSELPPSLQHLTIDLRNSGVTSLPELPRTVRCFAVELSKGSLIILPTLPDSLERFKLGVGRDKEPRFSCEDILETPDSWPFHTLSFSSLRARRYDDSARRSLEVGLTCPGGPMITCLITADIQLLPGAHCLADRLLIQGPGDTCFLS